MEGTPRLRSAYPASPPSFKRTPAQNGASKGPNGIPKYPHMSSPHSPKTQPPVPLISFNTIDGPSQRLYVVLFYIALFLWRLYDFYHLVLDDTESLWLFMKWVSMDGIFLFGLPGLRIPWLEWSSGAMTVLFLSHAIFDGILMFRVPIPLGASIVALSRILYDKELAISEHRVKAADILNDPSLILGRQIINILPEGSARLNPDNIPLCLESTKYAQTFLPLQINQTVPTSIELLRYDLSTDRNETISISSRQASKLRREAEKRASSNDYGALLLRHTVKKPGLYRLGRVMDETQMEVPHRSSEALVVTCPKAQIMQTEPNRCRGDISNLAIEVSGTPPLRLKYRKTVNGEDRDVSFQSIQPDDFVSPLLRHKGSGPLVSNENPNLSWAAASKITVPLTETLTTGGIWSYSIDEITDVAGNIVSYARPDPDDDRLDAKPSPPGSSFTVHERPTASLEGQGPRRTYKAAEGNSVKLPLRFKSGGSGVQSQEAHTISYLFTPASELSDDGSHSLEAQTRTEDLKADTAPLVSKPGLYSLQAVSTSFCPGDVQEPTTFLLVNPPRPHLDIDWRPISDKCADRPIGLIVDVDMTGTPPFEVAYTSYLPNGQKQLYSQSFDGPRGQIEFRPESAGKYMYAFTHISDDIYKNQDLRNREIEQDFKPSVGASFMGPKGQKTACIDDQVEFHVQLQGEGPWKLGYEMVHSGRRDKSEKHNITTKVTQLNTPPLRKGGEYSFRLTSVEDNQGCRETLSEEARISVRYQKPRGSFGLIEGKRVVKTLESKPVELPLRFTGEGPWRMRYRLPFDNPKESENVFSHANDKLLVQAPGKYELISLQDGMCPGTIDEAASTFEVAHVERPSLAISETPFIEQKGDKHTRKDVCEGEEDAFEITFSGQPPFDLQYQERVTPYHKSKSIRNQAMNVPVNTAQIKLDTAQAGTYDYIFSELGDYNYDHDPSQHEPLKLTQRVYPRPSAAFASPGKVYTSCHQASAEPLSSPEKSSQTIPIKLTGQPPFTLDLDLELRTHAKSKYSKPTPLTIPHIPSQNHDLQIPPHLLQPGQSFLRIRRVRDARGCERAIDPALPPNSPSHAAPSNRVQISVHDPPSLVPVEPDRLHYCVGERVAFALSGVAPFTVFYDFAGISRKASVPGPTFRRIAESPGNFTITELSDSASGCKASVPTRDGSKAIHAMPSVRVSKGRESRVDIHAGGTADIWFDFRGEPPFEFTFTRSANVDGEYAGHKGKGTGKRRAGEVLETKTLRSEGKGMKIQASEEGTYEVVAVRDAFCAFARPGSEGLVGLGRESGGGDRFRLEDGEEQGLLG